MTLLVPSTQFVILQSVTAGVLNQIQQVESASGGHTIPVGIAITWCHQPECCKGCLEWGVSLLMLVPNTATFI